MRPRLVVVAPFLAWAGCATSPHPPTAPPTQEPCSYRWQVAGDAVTIVAITPQGETPHPITGLPVPCVVEESAMSCGTFDVPVTSKGADWIVWLSPSEPDDVPILIVHAHVPRGCDL